MIRFIIILSSVVLVSVGCSRSSSNLHQESSDPFMAVIVSGDPPHLRQRKMSSLYDDAGPVLQADYRKHLVQSILEESDYLEASGHLGFIWRNDWVEQHPEMKSDFELVIAHVNELAQARGERSAYVIVEVDGKSVIGHRVGVE